MRVGLDERVLHRLVRFGCVAQVVKRDPRGAPLMTGDELGISLTRFGVAAFGLHRLDGGSGHAVGFAGGEARGLSTCHLITLPGGQCLP